MRRPVKGKIWSGIIKKVERLLNIKANLKLQGKKYVTGGGLHRSVASSAPTILWSQVRIPSMLFQFVLLKLK